VICSIAYMLEIIIAERKIMLRFVNSNKVLCSVFRNMAKEYPAALAN